MGFWNMQLFANDTTCDIKDTYMQFLEQQINKEEAYRKTYNEYEELIGTDEEAFFWYAMADTQWENGILLPEVKANALYFIGQKGGNFFCKDNSKKILEWEKTLEKLKEKIESPMPPEKKIKTTIEFVTNPWDIGDIYAYQFHTKKALEMNLGGKYILFQKIGDVEYYENKIYSVVQIFDRIFDYIPENEDIKDVKILPLIYAPGDKWMPKSIEKYMYPFDTYKRAIMIYQKKLDYPKNYFSFVGNHTIIEKEYSSKNCSDFFWQKGGMEEWLIEYYFSWKNAKC